MLRTVERLHVLGGLAGLGVAVGAAVDCLKCQPMSSHSTANPPYPLLPISLLHSPPFSRLNGCISSSHRRRKKGSALTSPHAAGEAADRGDRARGDSAPGDGGNCATGEHIGGVGESGVVYMGDWVFGRSCIGKLKLALLPSGYTRLHRQDRCSPAF